MTKKERIEEAARQIKRLKRSIETDKRKIETLKDNIAGSRNAMKFWRDYANDKALN